MPVIEPRNSEGLPLFAQTLEAQRLCQQPPPLDNFFVPQVVLFALPVLTIGGMLIAARPNIAQMGKNGLEAKVSGREQNSSRTVSSLARRSVDFYTAGVRGNMFSPPQLPKPIVQKPIAIKYDPPKKRDLPKIGDGLPPINPLQDWAYTGVVTMGESRMALLENTKTKEGQYVKQGDSFMGAQVGRITDHSIALSIGGKPQTLAKSDTINVTPLNANAPFMQGGGGQPGQPWVAPPAQMNAAVFTPPVGTVMDTGFSSIKMLGDSNQELIRSAIMNDAPKFDTLSIKR